MKLHRFGSKWAPPLLVAVATALVVSVAGAGSTPTPQQYTGCLKTDGNLVKIKLGTAPLHPCAKGETQITWSQTGPQGQPGHDGTSVTSATEAAGANCANGGSSFTSVSGKTYACNGAKGDKGDTGPSDLSALQGSPCTFDGHASTVSVSQDATTGVVTLTCKPVYLVGVTSNSGLTVTIFDFMDNSLSYKCGYASACSTAIPGGHDGRVDLASQGPFSFTCPGGSQESAEDEGDGVFLGSCFYNSLSSDYNITATFSG